MVSKIKRIVPGQVTFPQGGVEGFIMEINSSSFGERRRPKAQITLLVLIRKFLTHLLKQHFWRRLNPQSGMLTHPFRPAVCFFNTVILEKQL